MLLLKTVYIDTSSKLIVKGQTVFGLLSSIAAEEDRKRYCQLLARLHLPLELDDFRIRALLYLIDSIRDVR